MAAAAPRQVNKTISPNYARGPLAGNMQMGNMPAPVPGNMPAPVVRPMMSPAVPQHEPSYELPPQRRFVAPPSKAASQQRQQRAERLKALMRPGVLQLRDVDITLYDAAPLTLAEVQTRFGNRQQRMKATQTGDSNPSVTVQTDKIELSEMYMQWPEDGPGASNSASSLESSESARTAGLMTANVGRMRRFLLSSGQVVETLCMENLMAAGGRSVGFNEANSLPFSQRHSTLSLPAVLGERPSRDLTFDGGGGILLAAFGPPAHPPDDAAAAALGKREAATLRRVATGGILATWRLYRPDAPWAVMRVVGNPSCCLLPHTKPHLAFAGTDEGTVQLWNLREPGSSHPSIDLGGGDRLALRAPTYASDCLANANAHNSAIVQLAALPSASEEGELTVASLDDEGVLILWTVLEAVDVDATDLGQAIGGKERLMRIGTVPLNDDPAAPTAGASLEVLPTRCFGMHFVPSDASRLIVATDLPQLLHRTRSSAAPGAPAPTPPTPASFAPDVAQAASSGACGIAFCPSSPTHFLAGRTDGSISLYHVDDARPLLSWASFAKGKIMQVGWSASRPSVVWALDESKSLHAIDITDPSGRPLVSSPMLTSGKAGRPDLDAHRSPVNSADGGGNWKKKPTPPRFALDHRAGADTARGGADAGQRLAAVCAGGDVEVHVLTDTCAAAVPDEAAKLAHFLKRL